MGAIARYPRRIVRFLYVLLPVLLLARGSCLGASWPTVQAYPQVSASQLIADSSTQYSVATTIADNDGYNDIAEARVLFGYTESGGDSTKGRGYMSWGVSDSQITRYGGTWTLADATGGGRWGYRTDDWGGTTYIAPVSCSTSTSGSATGGSGTRTVTWTFKAKPAWAMNPLTNDADIYAADAAGNVIGWRDSPYDFDVVAATCVVECETPHAPLVGNPTASSLDVTIAPHDSGEDLFCIKVSPAVLRKEYVQADGTLGFIPVFQTKAVWGTRSITGLASGVNYSFKARAARVSPGRCPSQWGSSAAWMTPTLERTLNHGAAGTVINKGIHGQDAQPKTVSTQRLTDLLAISYNTSMRFGGDGYNWKTGTAQWNSSTKTTLQQLRDARDRNSYLQILTNTRGIGTGNGSTWVYTDQSAATLASLTADWVFYCNKLLQTKRQGDPLDAREQALLDSLSWGTEDKLLAPGEAAVPRVIYWEIGNEPEGPYPPPSLTPEDYAARYKTITPAVIAEDPDIKVGPCCMSADNGNAWLDAVFSDPANRVDFVNYHPYGPLYWVVKNTSGGVLNADDLGPNVNWMKQQQIDRRQKMIDRLAANSRPTNTPLVASECNPSSWEGTYYFNLNRTVAHALGVAETIFTFAELGFLASQYWDFPNWPSASAIEAPGQKVYKALQSYMGDRLLDSFTEPDFRLYTTRDTTTNRLVIWAINMSEYTDKTVRLHVTGGPVGASVFQHRLAALTGQTSLVTMNKSNDASEKVTWAITDITSTVDPSDFTLTFPRTTLTLLRFEPTP